MESIEQSEFRLSGGGVARVLSLRMGGQGASAFSPPTRLLMAIGLMWLPLAVLTLINGTFASDEIAQAFITDVVPQVRLLIALPLLLLAGLAIDPSVGGTIRGLALSGVVPQSEYPRFKTALSRITAMRDSIWPDIVLLVLAFAMTWTLRPGYGDAMFEVADKSWLQSVSEGRAILSMAGWWYLLVSAPLFQFILFRWIWRFIIWGVFLFRLSRIRLDLHATHPDFGGGIGMLGLSQQTFVVLFAALSAIVSSTIAHDMLFEAATFESARLEMLAFVVMCLVAIYAPLTLFTGQMYMARRHALRQYGALAYKLSAAFHEQWISRASEDVGKQLKEAVDPSAMADYGAVFDTVQNTRFIPVSMRNIVTTAASLVVPFLPLYLLQFSVADLIDRLLGALV